MCFIWSLRNFCWVRGCITVYTEKGLLVERRGVRVGWGSLRCPAHKKSFIPFIPFSSFCWLWSLCTFLAWIASTHRPHHYQDNHGTQCPRLNNKVTWPAGGKGGNKKGRVGRACQQGRKKKRAGYLKEYKVSFKLNTFYILFIYYIIRPDYTPTWES